MKTLTELNMTPLVAVVDIETAARTPNAMILSVGCVIVNVLEQVEVARFYSRCDLDSQFNREKETGTLEWWEKVKADHPESYNEAFSPDLERSPLEMVLTGLDAFFACHFGEAKRQVMGNGPEFDNVILSNACEQVGIEQPWHYGGNQSLRTAVLMGRLLLGIDPKYDLKKNPHPHHALFDAVHEADYLMAVFAGFINIKKQIGELNKIIHNQVVAMQSAYIEAAHGRGEKAGMGWIENTLFGPGFIPSDEEIEKAEGCAQLFYNGNCADPLGPCHVCGRPSGHAGAGIVACSDEHFNQAKECADGKAKA